MTHSSKKFFGCRVHDARREKRKAKQKKEQQKQRTLALNDTHPHELQLDDARLDKAAVAEQRIHRNGMAILRAFITRMEKTKHSK